MSFEFKPFTNTKKEGAAFEQGNDDTHIIANVLKELQTAGSNPIDVPKQPHELNPGQPRHEVHNDPRQIPKPEFTPDISPDAVVPKNPPSTM